MDLKLRNCMQFSRSKKMYKYTGCGLPKVYLSNGYEIHESPYGKGVTIHDLDGLHLALGEAVVNSPKPLVGHEFRFLRTELELSQAGLAELLGCNEQSVARWEKGKSKQVNAPAERLLRLIFRNSKLGDRKLDGVIKRLQALECTPPSPTTYVASEKRASWTAHAQGA